MAGWQWGVFSFPRRGDLGAVRIYCTCSVPQCCDRQHVMSLACFVMILIQDRMPFPPVSNWEAGASFACSASLSFLYSCFFLLRCIDFCVFNHSRHISLPIRFSWNKEGRKHFGKFEMQQVFCIISLTLDILVVCVVWGCLFFLFSKTSQFGFFWQLNLLTPRSFSHKQDQIAFPVLTSVSKENRIWKHL